MPSDTSTETRQRILTSAIQVFAEKGFEKASIRDIASHAQVNVASLYYHFGNKVELYRAVFADWASRDDATNETLDLEKASFAEIYTQFNRLLLVDLAAGHFTRLMARERIDPSGLLGDEWFNGIQKRN